MRVERTRAALGKPPPVPPARTCDHLESNQDLLSHNQPCRANYTMTTRSETWESNPAIPVPKTGGPPWTMSLVPRVGYAPTSPALQTGAVTRSAVEGHGVRGSNPPCEGENLATSRKSNAAKGKQTISLAPSAMDGAGEWSRTTLSLVTNELHSHECDAGQSCRGRNRTRGSCINGAASVPTHKPYNAGDVCRLRFARDRRTASSAVTSRRIVKERGLAPSAVTRPHAERCAKQPVRNERAAVPLPPTTTEHGVVATRFERASHRLKGGPLPIELRHRSQTSM